MTSRSGSGSRSRLAAVLLAAWVAVCATALGSAGADRTVDKVTVLVDGLPAEASIVSMVTIRTGDPFSAAAVDIALRRLFQTGLFADIKVERGGEDKVALTFGLTRNQVALRLKFKGFPIGREALVEAVSSLRPGDILLEARLNKAEAELKEELRRRGYFAADVRASLFNEGRAGVDVVFKASGWKRYRVAALEILGRPVFAKTELGRRMKTRAGAAYSPAGLERDIQKLTDFYSEQGYRRADIRLEGERFDEVAGTVALDLRIEPNEKIIIKTNGAKVPKGLLTSIWEERVFEEWGLAEGEARILNHFRKKGYLMTEVKGRLEKPAGELDVIYDITLGRKFAVENIVVEGARAFSAERIRSQLAVVEKSLFFSMISYDRLFSVPGDIEAFYRASGFPDAKAALEFEIKGKTVIAHLKIDEGQTQRVEKIVISGASAVPAAEIRKALGLAEGGPFYMPNVQRDAERIENLYLDHGFRGTKVEAGTRETVRGRIVLTYEIKEGRPFVIKDIYIIGNRHTRPSVIRKELMLKPGDRADFSLIQQSERRLNRLGIFSDVKMDEVQVSDSGEILLVKVREGEQNLYSLGIGLESGEEVRSMALWTNTFRPRGTAEYTRSNVFDTGAQAGILGQYSLIEKRVVGSWSQPYLFGLAIQPTMLGFYESEDMVSFAYRRSGFSINTISPLRKSLTMIATLRWARTELTRLEIAESDVDRELRPYSTAAASLTFIWDRRDDIFNPEKGMFFSVIGEVASPILGTESDYFKTYLKFQWFKPILSKLNFSITSRLGLGWGEIAIPERFFAGGSGSFRGESFDYLGPLDADTGKPVGGKAILLTNFELKFPLMPTMPALSGVTFFDIGNVYATPSDISLSNMEKAAGGGLRYRTPLGPVRLEVAWRLWDKLNRTRPLFFITIGNVF